MSAGSAVWSALQFLRQAREENEILLWRYSKSDAFQMIRCRQFQTGAVAASKLFAVFLCGGFMGPLDQRCEEHTDKADYSLCDFCPSRFFWFSLLIHDAGTFQTMLHAAAEWRALVNATMTEQSSLTWQNWQRLRLHQQKGG